MLRYIVMACTFKAWHGYGLRADEVALAPRYSHGPNSYGLQVDEARLGQTANESGGDGGGVPAVPDDAARRSLCGLIDPHVP